MRLIDSSTTAHTLMSLSAAKNREVNDRKNQWSLLTISINYYDKIIPYIRKRADIELDKNAGKFARDLDQIKNIRNNFKIF